MATFYNRDNNEFLHVGAPFNFSRGEKMPIDDTQVWNTLSDMQDYVLSGKVSYIGQYLVLSETSSSDAVPYFVKNSGSLEKIATSSDIYNSKYVPAQAKSASTGICCDVDSSLRYWRIGPSTLEKIDYHFTDVTVHIKSSFVKGSTNYPIALTIWDEDPSTGSKTYVAMSKNTITQVADTDVTWLFNICSIPVGHRCIFQTLNDWTGMDVGTLVWDPKRCSTTLLQVNFTKDTSNTDFGYCDTSDGVIKVNGMTAQTTIGYHTSFIFATFNNYGGTKYYATLCSDNSIDITPITNQTLDYLFHYVDQQMTSANAKIDYLSGAVTLSTMVSYPYYRSYDRYWTNFFTTIDESNIKDSDLQSNTKYYGFRFSLSQFGLSKGENLSISLEENDSDSTDTHATISIDIVSTDSIDDIVCSSTNTEDIYHGGTVHTFCFPGANLDPDRIYLALFKCSTGKTREVPVKFYYHSDTWTDDNGPMMLWSGSGTDVSYASNQQTPIISVHVENLAYKQEVQYRTLSANEIDSRLCAISRERNDSLDDLWSRISSIQYVKSSSFIEDGTDDYILLSDNVYYGKRNDSTWLSGMSLDTIISASDIVGCGYPVEQSADTFTFQECTDVMCNIFQWFKDRR